MTETPEQRIIVRKYTTRRVFMLRALRALSKGGPRGNYSTYDARSFFGWDGISLFRQLLDEECPEDDGPILRPSTTTERPPGLAERHEAMRRANPPHVEVGALAGALRALTPEGTLADLHAGRHCFWPRTSEGLYMWTLLEGERPDLLPWARIWNALEHERLIIPDAFITPLDDAMIQRTSTPILGHGTTLRGVFWSSKVFKKASRGGRYGLMLDALTTLTNLASDASADRFYFPLIRFLRSAVMDGLELPHQLEPPTHDDPIMAYLPFTPEGFDAVIGSYDELHPEPSEPDHTRAQAWRRLATVCFEPVRADTLGWLDRLVGALEARDGVDDPTALIVGLEVYCAGFPDHGTRIWRTRTVDAPSDPHAN